MLTPSAGQSATLLSPETATSPVMLLVAFYAAWWLRMSHDPAAAIRKPTLCLLKVVYSVVAPVHRQLIR